MIMKQEEKDLLLKDLCGRLPYGVIVAEFDEDCRRTSIALPLVSSENDFSFYGNLKPYLFPLSSMTEEQMNISPVSLSILELLKENGNFGIIEYSELNLSFSELVILIDWLNKNHFDYRGLIEKSLALDATGLGIYK